MSEIDKTLTFAWEMRTGFYKENYKLSVDGDKLYVAGNKLFTEADNEGRNTKGYKLSAEAKKLCRESDKLYAEAAKRRADGDLIWAEAVLLVCGNIKMSWHHGMGYQECDLGEWGKFKRNI